MTADEVRARIAEIDKWFAEATGWGSWMAMASSERQSLVSYARSLGVDVPDKHVMTSGGRPIVD